MDILTRCIHTENEKRDNTGAISVPIYQSATFCHRGVGESTGFDYSRMQNPTREHLEKLVASLECGKDALAFSTGMAAIDTVMELFKPGDEIIASDDIYGGSYRFFKNISEKNGLIVKFADTSNLQETEGCLSSVTKAIFIESPTNPTMKISDIKAVAELAKKRNMLTIVDNTFLTPYLMQPLLLGADIVIHSGTKYLGGHNDTLAGFVVVKDEILLERLRFIYKTKGACLSPFDSWLLIRGIKTLGVRMDRQQENAEKIFQWLKREKAITKIYFAADPESAGYSINNKQARGGGAMISFEVDAKETALRILENVNVISFAESLGGVETLITYPILQTHGDIPEEIREKIGINDRLLRLSVGLENADDLIHDLQGAIRNGI